MKNKILSVVLIIVLTLALSTLIAPNFANATDYSSDMNEDASSLVNKVLGSGLNAKNAKRQGAVYTFTNGKDDFGVETGIILDTSGQGPASEKDADLEKIMDYPYGGDTANLEFTMTATGELLNFNYVFASGEFEYGPEYNDVFGLFVSVNGGAWENIAKITNKSGQEIPVNITNLKANPDTYTEKQIAIGQEGANGVSKVFNAQKKVKKGDTVKVKFVIADVSDSAVDSYVLIEGGSLSFDAPGAKCDYKNEVLKSLDPSATYKISDGANTYEITSDSKGEIKLVGKDNNNKDYNFVGKKIQVVKKGEGEIPDSEAQEVVVNQRPNKPDDISNLTETPKDIDVDDIEITDKEIKILAKPGQEYSLDKKTWIVADKDGYVVFSNLDPNKEYTVYTRVAATNKSFVSETTEGTKIVTKNMVKNLKFTEKNYEGLYDEKEHYASVTSEEGVEIKYSQSLYGDYSKDVVKYKNPGTYTVYYSLSKEGYYPKYGTLTVTINKMKMVKSEKENVYNTKIANTEDELMSKINFTKEELSELNKKKGVEVYLDVKDISNSISEEDKKAIGTKAKDNQNVSLYLDINLYKKIEGQKAQKITKTNKPIKITFDLPESLINTNSDVERTIKAFRLHDGVVTELDVVVNGTTGTIETDEFSPYAIAYTDVNKTEANKTEFSEDNPKTGDDIMTCVCIMFIATLGIVSTFIIKKK